MFNKICKCCTYIIGPRDEDRHCVSADRAKALGFPNQPCPQCKELTIAHCMLGIGHFVFTCKKCHHKWSNI